MNGDSALIDEPKYKRYSGKSCDTCNRIITITIRYDKRSSDNVEEWSYVSFRCNCGMLLAYRNGSWSYVAKKDFDKNKMLTDDFKQAGIGVKDPNVRKDQMPSI
jgi:hypothetical protein